MDGCVMGLTTVSASVGTPAVSSVVAHSQTVLAQALGLYVVQPLSHSHGLPLGAEEEWMSVRLAEDTFPLVGGSWSGDMDVGPLSVWSRIWSLVLLPGRLLLLGLWSSPGVRRSGRQSLCMVADKLQQVTDRWHSLVFLGVLLPECLELDGEYHGDDRCHQVILASMFEAGNG